MLVRCVCVLTPVAANFFSAYDLPEAYRGKNMYLRDTIDGFIMGDNEPVGFLQSTVSD